MHTRSSVARVLQVAVLLIIVLTVVPFAKAVPTGAAMVSSEVEDSDTIPPAPIINLNAETGPLPGTVILNWNAPGDDATAGIAASYVIRYALAPVDEATWDSATDVTGEPVPEPAGAPQSMVVGGLPAGQKVYFAIQSQDEVPNTSSISNVAAGVAQRQPYLVYVPIVASNTVFQPIVVPETTEVLPDATLDDLVSVSADGAVFTFDGTSSALSELDPGDVLVAGVTDATPEGALRKVTNTTMVGDDVVVTTEQATLEDAIQEGDFAYSGKLVPSQVVRSTQLAGVSLASVDGLADEFYVKIDDVEFDIDGNPATTYDILEVDGSVRFGLDFDFTWSIDDWTLKQLEFVSRATETAELEVRWNILSVDFLDKEKILARYTLTPVTVMAGPVPVVFTPEIVVKVSLKGEIKVGLVGKTTQEAVFTAGIRYGAGTWKPVADLDNTFSADPPAVSGSAALDIKAAGSVDLGLKLYGIAGPYCGIQAYMKLEADTAQDPWWTLYGGLEVPMGVKVEALGKTLADYETVAIGYRVALRQAQTNDPPYVPAAPSPANGRTDRSVNVNLSWTGGDPDDDTLTYDVYFEAGDATPDAPVSDDQSDPYYDPGTLAAQTTYYWQIVSEDEHGATTAGPIWRFTTGSGGVVLADNFTGTWLNEDPDTLGVTQATIAEQGINLVVHMWGSCSPTDCDWGTTQTTVTDAADGVLNIVWDHGFVIATQSLTLLSDGRLRVDDHRHYTDDSGRADRDATYYFIKQ